MIYEILKAENGYVLKEVVNNNFDDRVVREVPRGKTIKGLYIGRTVRELTKRIKKDFEVSEEVKR